MGDFPNSQLGKKNSLLATPSSKGFTTSFTAGGSLRETHVRQARKKEGGKEVKKEGRKKGRTEI